MNTLYKIAKVNEFEHLLDKTNINSVINFVAAHTLGELEANLAMFENVRGLSQGIGRFYKKQHDMGFFPEDHMDKLAEHNPENKRILEEIRFRSRERAMGFSPKQIDRKIGIGEMEPGKGKFMDRFKRKIK